MRLSRFSALVLLLVTAASCDLNPTGSGSAGAVGLVLPRFSGQSVAPQFNTSVGRIAAQIVSVRTGVVVLSRDYTISDISQTGATEEDFGTLEIQFTIPEGGAQDQYELKLDVYNEAGVLAFSIGPVQFTLGTDGRTARVEDVPTRYVGPGSGVTSVRLEPASLTLAQGETVPVSCVGSPGNTSNFPWFLDTDNQSIASVGDATVTGVNPGTTQILCQMEFAPRASATMNVTVTARPGSLTIVSGTGQSAPINTALPQPIRFLVRGLSNQPLAGVRVQIAVQTGGGQVSLNEVTTGSDGTGQVTWTLGSLVGVQTLRLVVPGVNLEQTVSATGLQAAFGSVNGRITNRVNGAALQGATVELRSGGISGTLVASATTNATGDYGLSSVVAGNYTVVARATGFGIGAVAASVTPNTPTTANVLLDPVVGANEIIIEVNWLSATDLDAHLLLPTGTFIFWENLGSCLVSPFACLENDDATTGIRPERTRIAVQSAGVHRYFVHNYSADINELGAGDLSLAQSGAVVTVRRGTTLIFSANVPNAPGNLWEVFTLNGTVITPVGTVSHVDLYNLDTGPPPTGAASGLTGKARGR